MIDKLPNLIARKQKTTTIKEGIQEGRKMKILVGSMNEWDREREMLKTFWKEKKHSTKHKRQQQPKKKKKKTTHFAES